MLSALLALLASACAAAPAQEDPGRLVVLNKSASTALVLQLPEGERLAELPTGAGPHEIAVHPGGRYAVVADYGSGSPGRSLTVLDLQALEVERTVDLGEPVRPHGLDFEPDGKHLWMSAEGVGQAWRLAWPSGEVVARVDTGARASHMVVHHGAGEAARVYVANIGSGSVTPIVAAAPAAAGWTALEPVATGSGAEGLALSAGGGTLWVSNREADTVTVLDTSDLGVRKELAAQGFPIRVYLTPDGERALVSCARANEIAVFDTAKLELVGRARIVFDATDTGEGRLFSDRFGQSAVPIGVAIRPDSKVAYVACSNADAVAVLDLESLEVTGALPTGREPDGITWVPAPQAE